MHLVDFLMIVSIPRTIRTSLPVFPDPRLLYLEVSRSRRGRQPPIHQDFDLLGHQELVR